MILALVMVAAGIFFALRLRVNTDISSLMPEGSRISGALLQSLEDFGTTDRLILVIESRDAGETGLAEKRRELKAMADQLTTAMKETGLFVSVEHKVTAEQRAFFENLYFSHPFHYHNAESLQAVKNSLTEAEIERRVAGLGKKLRLSPFGSGSQEQLLRDPLGFRDGALTPGHMNGFELDISDGYFFSPDGSFLLIVARPIKPSQDTVFDSELLKKIEGLLGDAGGTGYFSSGFSMAMGAGIEVQLLGPYVETLYGSSAAAKEILPSIIASALGLLILFGTVYRNLGALLILAVPLLTGIAVTAGVTSLFIGHLTMISVGFAVMLAGLGVDFGIHLLERTGQESTPGSELRNSIATAFGTTGRSVLAGALTSAAIFFLIATSDFAALQEFGWIIALGILFTMFSMFVLLPALLVSFPSPFRSGRRKLPASWPSWVVGHARLLIALAMALTLALAYAASMLELESNIYQLGPLNQPYEQQKERLLAKAGGSTNVVLAVLENQDLQSLLESQESIENTLAALKERGEILSFESLSSLLPSEKRQEKRVRIVQAWKLDDSMAVFERSTREAGFRPAVFETFIGDVLGYNSGREKFVKLDDLEGTAAGGLVDSFLVQVEGGWRAVSYIYPLPGQWEDKVPLQVINAIEAAGDGVTVTGIVPSFGEIARVTQGEFLKLTAWAFFLVLLIALLFFRKIFLSALSLLAAVVGLVWTLGLMKLAGIELNLITVLVAPLVLGLGIDDALHVLNRYRENPEDIAETVRTVSGAVLMTTATTMIGFGSLAFADIPSLRSLGITVSIGMACCAITSLVLLPALLKAFADRR